MNDASRIGVQLEVENRAGFTRDMGAAAASVDHLGSQVTSAGTASMSTGRRVSLLGRIGSAAGSLLRSGLTLVLHGLRWALIAAAGAALYLAKQSIEAAGDLGESINKASVTFGRSRKIILAWSKTTARALGTSRREALESASGFGQILKASGFTDKAAAHMSKTMVELAGDLASFHNLDTADALEKIRSGLVGEAEPLRTLGVLLSENAMQEEAYRLGIAKRGETLTEAQKVQARYHLILEQTSDAQGDFARTSGSMANQQRILSARFEDLSAKLGKKILPLALKLVRWANRTMPGAMKNVGGAFEAVTESWDAMVATFGVGLGNLFGLFRQWADFMFRWAGSVVDAFAISFGWLPGLGADIEGAQEMFHEFQRGVVNDLRNMEVRFKGWDVAVTERFRHAGKEWRAFLDGVESGPGSAAMAPFGFAPPSVNQSVPSPSSGGGGRHGGRRHGHTGSSFFDQFVPPGQRDADTTLKGIHVDSITIHTQATDGRGLLKELKRELGKEAARR